MTILNLPVSPFSMSSSTVAGTSARYMHGKPTAAVVLRLSHWVGPPLMAPLNAPPQSVARVMEATMAMSCPACMQCMPSF